MTTTAATGTAVPPQRQVLRDAVVVGVDGSGGGAGAVTWAARDAMVTGRPLHVVTVLEEPVHRADPAHREHLLGSVVDRLRADLPGLDVRYDAVEGATAQVLLDLSVGQAMLVVGNRARGVVGHPLAGSTSLAVAARSRVPVVIVPDHWRLDEGAPVAVGVAPGLMHPAAVRFALVEAQRREVPLVLVHGWSRPGASPAGDTTAAEVGREIAEHRHGTGSVPVRTAHGTGDESRVLLAASEHAQLLVLGRGAARRLGCAPGSITRTVLGSSAVPVVVVPFA